MTKRDAFCASASAQPLPVIPTQILPRKKNISDLAMRSIYPGYSFCEFVHVQPLSFLECGSTCAQACVGAWRGSKSTAPLGLRRFLSALKYIGFNQSKSFNQLDTKLTGNVTCFNKYQSTGMHTTDGDLEPTIFNTMLCACCTRYVCLPASQPACLSMVRMARVMLCMLGCLTHPQNKLENPTVKPALKMAYAANSKFFM